jgi:transglutaminase-like putative cysteine protease
VSAELVGEAAKFQIAFVPEYQRMLLHRVELRRDGQWFDRMRPESVTLARREAQFESDLATGEVAALVVIEDVRRGDVLRVSYTLEGSNPVLAGMSNDEFRFAWISPILDRHARVLYPAGTKVATRSERGAPAARIRSDATRVEVVAAAHGVAAVQDDSDYPPWYSPWATLEIGERRTWADVARWAVALYPDSGPLPEQLRDRVAEWRALPTRDERVLAALRAVQEEVRYFGTELGESTHRPADPAETWRRRYGDCKDKARLLSVLLRELGIAAEPALVSAAVGRGVGDRLPAATAFNHVIVRARDGDETWWLDPTMTQQRGALAAIGVGNFGVALPVAPAQQELVEVRRGAPPDTKRVVERWQPSEDGESAELTITTTMTGALADGARRVISSEGAEAMSRRFAEFYRRVFGEVEVVEPLAARDDEAVNRVELVERYRLPQPWSVEAGGERGLDVSADSILEAAQLPRWTARQSPLALGDPLRISHSIEVALPRGWSVSDTVSELEVQGKGIKFERKSRPGKELLVIDESFERALSEVGVEHVAEHIAARRRIVEAASFRLVLAVPSKERARSRDERMRQLMRGILDERESNRATGEPR